MRENNLRPARDLKLESLEDRTLFDAAPFVDPELLNLSPESEVSQVRSYESPATRTEVVFIDAGVQDPEAFVSEFASDQFNVQFQFLDASTDGLEQIADYLEGRRNIDAVHIISHGNQAELILGDAVIHGDQLSLYANELRTIGAALSPDADILIYGCNLGSDEAGREFVRTFADLTDADVAASDDLTGHQNLGGDWDLEVARGFIEAAHGVSERFALDYGAVLSDLYVTKDDADVVAVPGELLIYTINYGNAGTSDAFDVVITETLAPGTSFDDANSSFGWLETAQGSGVYEYYVGTVPVSVSGSVQFAISVETQAAAGIDEITNTVSIVDDGTNGPDENPADNIATDIDVLTAVADLYVTQDDGVVDSSVGDMLIYTITYGNDGHQGASNVVITETPAAGTTFDSANSSFGWFETGPAGGVFTYELGTVASLTSGSVQFAVTIDSQSDGVTQLANNVTIADDGANGAETDTSDNGAIDTNNVSAAPDLIVIMNDGDVSAQPDESIVYTLNYANHGTQDATNVVITESVPEHTTFDAANSDPAWVGVGGGTYTLTLSSLAVGESGSVDFAVVVNDPVPAGVTQTDNTAAIEDDGSNGAEENPTDNESSDSTPIVFDPPDLGLSLYVSTDDGLNVVSAGESVAYTINYGNSGDVDATGVVLSEALPVSATYDAANSSFGWTESFLGSGVFEFVLGTVPANTSGSVHFAVVVDDALAAGVDQLINSVTIADDGTNGMDVNLADNSGTDVNDLNAAPEYSVTKTDGITSAQPGQSITYEVTVTNNGNQDGTGVFVSDTYPASVLEIATASKGGIVDEVGGTITWNLGNLAAGDTVDLVVIAAVKDPLVAAVDNFTNFVDVTDDGANGLDPVPNNDSASDTNELVADPIGMAPAYTVTTTADAATISPSDALTYTIEVTNIGNQTGLDVFVQESFRADAYNTILADNGGLVDAAGGTINWNIAALSAGETVTLTVVADVADSFAAGVETIESSASVTDDDVAVATAVTSVVVDAAPELEVVKSTTTTAADDGATVNYTIQYANNGTQDATGVVVTEHLHPGTTFDPGNSSLGWVERGDGEHIDFVVGALAAGESRTISYAVTIDDVDLIGDVLENRVEVIDDGANGTEAELENNLDVQLISTRVLDNELISLRQLLTTTSSGAYAGLVPIDPDPQHTLPEVEPSVSANPVGPFNDGTDPDSSDILDRLSRWGRFLSWGNRG